MASNGSPNADDVPVPQQWNSSLHCSATRPSYSEVRVARQQRRDDVHDAPGLSVAHVFSADRNDDSGNRRYGQVYRNGRDGALDGHAGYGFNGWRNNVSLNRTAGQRHRDDRLGWLGQHVEQGFSARRNDDSGNRAAVQVYRGDRDGALGGSVGHGLSAWRNDDSVNRTGGQSYCGGRDGALGHHIGQGFSAERNVDPEGLAVGQWHPGGFVGSRGQGVRHGFSSTAHAFPRSKPPGVAEPMVERQQPESRLAKRESSIPASPPAPCIAPTTLFVRNLSRKSSQQDALRFWPVHVYNYNALFVAYDLKRQRGQGSMIVNFVTPESAAAFFYEWSGRVCPPLSATDHNGVNLAFDIRDAPVQGFGGNVEHWKLTLTETADVELMPAIFFGGQRQDWRRYVQTMPSAPVLAPLALSVISL